MLEQRYIMAVVYFATQGNFWTNCAQDSIGGSCDPILDKLQPGYNPNGSRWLGEMNECNWLGVRCPTNAQCIQIIDIGKFHLYIFINK